MYDVTEEEHRAFQRDLARRIADIFEIPVELLRVDAFIVEGTAVVIDDEQLALPAPRSDETR